MHSAFFHLLIVVGHHQNFEVQLSLYLPCRVAEPLLRRLPCVENARLVLRMLPPLACRVLLTFTHDRFFFSAIICLLLRSLLLLLLMCRKVKYSNMILSGRIYDIYFFSLINLYIFPYFPFRYIPWKWKMSHSTYIIRQLANGITSINELTQNIKMS